MRECVYRQQVSPELRESRKFISHAPGKAAVRGGKGGGDRWALGAPGLRASAPLHGPARQLEERAL
jgi:hypothetical protein